MPTPRTARDINTVSDYLSLPDIDSCLTLSSETILLSLYGFPPIDCLVICVSSVLHGASTVFEALQSQPDMAKTIVFCGGIGHSTSHIYSAVARHPVFSAIADEVRGLPEARVLEMIYERFYREASQSSQASQAPRILIEERSTNCGANAVETRRLLEANGITEMERMVIVQDPTMLKRTIAGFEKVYADAKLPRRFEGWPIFVPRVEFVRGEDGKEGGGGRIRYQRQTADLEGIWEMDRFLGLIMGEIPRLRDDEQGYGPRGKGFIAHVDVPREVEAAWRRLQGELSYSR